jgi:hypothetical protein
MHKPLAKCKATMASKKKNYQTHLVTEDLRKDIKGENNLFFTSFSLHFHKTLPFYMLL